MSGVVLREYVATVKTWRNFSSYGSKVSFNCLRAFTLRLTANRGIGFVARAAVASAVFRRNVRRVVILCILGVYDVVMCRQACFCPDGQAADCALAVSCIVECGQLYSGIRSVVCILGSLFT